jgi:hypothetical protein
VPDLPRTLPVLGPLLDGGEDRGGTPAAPGRVGADDLSRDEVLDGQHWLALAGFPAPRGSLGGGHATGHAVDGVGERPPSALAPDRTVSAQRDRLVGPVRVIEESCPSGAASAPNPRRVRVVAVPSARRP